MQNRILFAVGCGLAFAAATPVLAADLGRLPTKAPAAVVAPAMNWTGFYIGAHIGGAWGTSSNFGVAPGFVDTGSHDFDGFVGGGQIGLNYQVGAVVLGIEADAGFGDLTGSHASAVDPGDRLSTKVDRYGTVTGRLGYAFDQALLYVKGGGAWIHTEHGYSFGAFDPFSRSDDTRWGWTVGAGLEYALTPNWSAKVEYAYLDFGSEQVEFRCLGNCVPAVQMFEVDQHVHTLKVGVNYRFNWSGPAVR